MLTSWLPYAEALIGAAILFVAIIAFRPMKRYCIAKPATSTNSISIGSEMLVVAWLALVITGTALEMYAVL